jgi:ERCC4-type nuclease
LSPSIIWYEKLFNDYYRLCDELGFANKYVTTIGFPPRQVKLESVIVDTREQNPLLFKNFQAAKLDFGDYLLKGSEASVYFERKSLNDLISTIGMGQNLERFKKELELADKQNFNLIIVIEADLNEALNINKTIQGKFYFGKLNSEYIFHNIRELIQSYPHIQFLFVRNRDESMRVMKKIFYSNNLFTLIDLQLAYDKGIL